MRYFILLFLLALHFSCFAFKEYPTLASYKKENPSGRLDGSEGNWLTADRKKTNAVWEKANEQNLQRTDGFNAYQHIQERACFFRWFQRKASQLGYQTKWPKLAATTTYRLSFLVQKIPCALGYSNREIKDFILEGNRLIFNDCWPELQSLLLHKPMNSDETRAWDSAVLLREQQLIHHLYLKLSKKSLHQLEKILSKETLPTKFIPGIEFEGSLVSVEDVYFYGMKMMGY